MKKIIDQKDLADLNTEERVDLIQAQEEGEEGEEGMAGSMSKPGEIISSDPDTMRAGVGLIPQNPEFPTDLDVKDELDTNDLPTNR